VCLIARHSSLAANTGVSYSLAAHTHVAPLAFDTLILQSKNSCPSCGGQIEKDVIRRFVLSRVIDGVIYKLIRGLIFDMRRRARV
jgi:hypothetical protein